jgi:hypothetical protein
MLDILKKQDNTKLLAFELAIKDTIARNIRPKLN